MRDEFEACKQTCKMLQKNQKSSY